MNRSVSLGKYGTFSSNQIIGRPFYLTFELQDGNEDEEGSKVSLRIISWAELHTEALISEGSGEADGEGEELELINGTTTSTPLRTNREIVDEASTQRMTLEEIEALKKESSGAGREIVSRLLESHATLDQKTAFSLAKYTLRKQKKYMKRFTVLPLDVGLLTNYMLHERDALKTMELRTELMGMIGCLGNVHHAGNVPMSGQESRPNGRYLVVDDTGGLVVAAMAERMSILYPHNDDDTSDNGEDEEKEPEGTNNTRRRRAPAPMSASDNTITLLHPHSQPNISLLKYFGYEVDDPDESHPLHTHLKTVSWLQLLDPNADPIYSTEPETIPDSILSTYKPSKRSAYHRKRNRWARVRNVVDETRAGGFDGLIVATLMEPASIFKHVIPLLAGSAPVVVYSSVIEPLVGLVDLYSTARRSAYVVRRRELDFQYQQRQSSSSASSPSSGSEQPCTNGNNKDDDADDNVPTSDYVPPYLPELEAEFPINPALLLAPSLHTARVRPWQVLPGRTHPLMSGRGGAEGYVFHALRVLPSPEHIQAAGNPSRKRRKVLPEE